MTDPLHPSRSFAEIIAAGLPADIETAHCDRLAHLLSDRPALATGRSVTLAEVDGDEELERQLGFLKALPVDAVATRQVVPDDMRQRADAIVVERRSDAQRGDAVRDTPVRTRLP